MLYYDLEISMVDVLFYYCTVQHNVPMHIFDLAISVTWDEFFGVSEPVEVKPFSKVEPVWVKVHHTKKVVSDHDARQS